MAIQVEIARVLSMRVVSMQGRGQTPNYEASIVKLYTGELEQRIAALAFRLGGLKGQLTGRDGAPLSGRLGRFQLHSVAATIGGGTSEVQRNIIATRGLGLPRG
jgi:alkylation response protein AidB-like acyl-CoA dehydrogenase